MSGVIEQLEKRLGISRTCLKSGSLVNWNDPKLSELPKGPEFTINTVTNPIKVEELIEEYPTKPALEVEFDFDLYYSHYNKKYNYQEILNDCVSSMQRLIKTYKNSEVAERASRVLHTLGNKNNITVNDVRTFAEAVYYTEQFAEALS